MRYIFQGTFTDGMGRAVLGGTVSVYLAGTTTAASVYAASSGGTAVNSVASSSTDGSFLFYVDDGDYAPNQKLKIILSKTNFISRTLDNIEIFPRLATAWTSAKTGDYTVLTTDGGCHFNNSGATGTVAFSLPAATVGLGPYGFVRIADFSVTIDPNLTEVIQGGGAGKYLELDTVGDSVIIECHEAGRWELMASNGTLAYES